MSEKPVKLDPTKNEAYWQKKAAEGAAAIQNGSQSTVTPARNANAGASSRSSRATALFASRRAATDPRQVAAAVLAPSILPAPFAADASPAQQHIDKIAADVKAAGVPDELNRWKTMTPAQLKENETARANVVKQNGKTSTARKLKIAPGSISSGLPKGGLDAAGLKIKAEIDKAKEQSKMERLKALREAKANKSPTMKQSFTADQKTKLETARQQHLTDVAKTADVQITKIPTGMTAAKAAKIAAKTAKTQTPKTPKTAPKKTTSPAKAEQIKKRFDTLTDAMKKPNGITNADMVALIGKREHVRRLEAACKDRKLKFKLIEKEGKTKRYCAI